MLWKWTTVSPQVQRVEVWIQPLRLLFSSRSSSCSPAFPVFCFPPGSSPHLSHISLVSASVPVCMWVFILSVFIKAPSFVEPASLPCLQQSWYVSKKQLCETSVETSSSFTERSCVHANGNSSRWTHASLNFTESVWRHVIMMSPYAALAVVVVAAGWCLCAADVGDFAPCLQFFYKSWPPKGPSGTPICQRYYNQYRFATLYSRPRRSPWFSAYVYSVPAGKRPSASWKFEPQVRIFLNTLLSDSLIWNVNLKY